MNKIKRIISKLTREQKSIIISGIICVIAIAVIINLRSSLANPNTGYLKDQVIDGLSFENANLVVENGISKFTAEVYNENKTEYQLQYISIILKDKSGNTTTLIGYIGNKLQPQEGKYITASIDQDLSLSDSLEYVINK